LQILGGLIALGILLAFGALAFSFLLAVVRG
jgi:hypothetical protein